MKRSFTQVQDSEITKRACKTFFTQVDNSLTYKCICGVERKKGNTGGWSNLWTHILSDHPDYQDHVNKTEPLTLDALIGRKKEKNIFGWLDWIIGESKFFNTVEKPLTKKYTNLMPISNETFLKYMNLVTKEVEKIVCIS